MVELRRLSFSPYGILGELQMHGRTLCYTLEDPDNNNLVGNSCIPEGTYICVPHNGTRYKNVWRLESVPGRTAILIHQGNTLNDTRGCILVGRRAGTLRGLPAVLESRAALEDLRKTLPKTFNLTIRSIK
jgi:hypothetical protein